MTTPMTDRPGTDPTSPNGRGTFALAPPRIRMAPSILSADFGRLAEEVHAVEAAGAEMLHLDVMDGHFVPNISFGVPVVASLRKHSRAFFDAHLMIADPLDYAEPFVKAGCDLITFHIEVTAEGAECPVRPASTVGDGKGGDAWSARGRTPSAGAVIERIRGLGAAVGVSLNPDTPVSAVASILDQVDLVLVMSVWPGFGGQRFMPAVLSKVEELRLRLRPDQRLQIDGGIDPSTIASAASAGADTFVAGTAIFRQPDPAAAMRNLQALAETAPGTAGQPRA